MRNIAHLVESRRDHWRQLEELCARLDRPRAGRTSAAAIARFGALYRAACADLALAESYQLPPRTVAYLHHLVGRAHNQLYRSRRFQFRAWSDELLVHIPRRLFRDNALRLAATLFWGVFVIGFFLASDLSPYPQFAEQMATERVLADLREMHGAAPEEMDRGLIGGSAGAGFYISHNTTIGLRVFVGGLLLGVGGLFATVFNAAFLGAVFGYMTRSPERDNFFHFVTAHGPFEFTAIVLSAAAGMRLGFSIVSTGGRGRGESLREAGVESMPVMGCAMLFFLFAALIEGFISPSALPYPWKAGVGALSTAMLMVYFIYLGQPKPLRRAEGEHGV